MASAHATTRSILSSFLPRLSASTTSSTSRFATLYSRQLSIPLLPALGFALPSAIQLNLPGLVEGIWESILRAVPKKKTSHMKKRHRQYAGKALKDMTALNKCSACGNVKRAHLLCPYCVNEIKGMFRKSWRRDPANMTNDPTNHHVVDWNMVKRRALKEQRKEEREEREERRAASKRTSVDSTGRGL